MQTRNPVLGRIGQEPTSSGGSGFAYQEGMSAYQQAQPGAAATDYATQTRGTPQPVSVGARLTLNDVIVKTAISFGVLLVGAVIGWQLTPSAPWLFWVAMIVGLGLGLTNAFKKQVSPPLILAYSLVQGVFLGGISWTYNEWVQTVNPEYTGLVGQAVVATFVVFGVMLAIYQSRIVKVNGRFMKIMMVAMVSYLFIAIASLVSALFGVGGGWGFYGVGGLGIALMAFAVLLAAFSLMLDFEAIKQGVAMGLPERESWRMAFGLLVTLIWLYLEILRLLAILAAGRE
jgi:uncharacterized YccA/Bax inhibitor family protein